MNAASRIDFGDKDMQAEQKQEVVVGQDSRNTWPDMIARVVLFALFALLAGIFFYLDWRGGSGLGQISEAWSVAAFLSYTFAFAAAYELVAIAINKAIRMRRGSVGEVKMLTAFARILAGVLIAGLLLAATGTLKQYATALGAFVGMLLGWSLQAPVSGVAAWILITLKRPFRIGDRVLFPSLGLLGDVLEVGLMYTKLNQVGGSIGSEDAIGRYILIPNAMLFGQVAINYTPHQESSYFLDEVVIRLTYDSDWDTAEKILMNAARKVTAQIIKATEKEPYVRADMYDYGVFMRLRYMTLATDRPRISHEITSIIFREFQRQPRVDFAIPFVYSSRKGGDNCPGDTQAQDRAIDLSTDDIEDPMAGKPLSPEEEKGVAALAVKFKDSPAVQPVVVRETDGGKYRLVSGHFRYLACKRLGMSKIPALLRHGPDTTIDSETI